MAHRFAAQLLNRNVLILLSLAALLTCVFLKPMVLSRSVYNFQVTFDISQSMKVEDHINGDAAASRISAAKDAALGLMQSLPCGSRIGWSVFTGRRVVSLITPVEVCQHYAGLLSSLSYIDGTMRWANASGIGKGLHQSIRAADSIGDSTKIVFMSDGQEAPPLRAGQRGMPKTDKYSISGLIVGVGGMTPVRIPKIISKDGQITTYWQADKVVQRTDAIIGQSHEELSSRQDVHLSKLGRLADLIYLPLDSTDLLGDAAMIKSLAHEKKVPVDLRWIPASFALFFLCWRFMPWPQSGRQTLDL